MFNMEAAPSTPSPDEIEPGLIPLFRQLITLRFVLSSLTVCLWLVSEEVRVRSLPFPALLETGFLLIYLSWSWPRRALRQLYLPVAILICAAGPILWYMLIVLIRVGFGPPDQPLTDDSWLLILSLLIPLLVVSWQYRMGAVITFSLGVVALQMAALIPIGLAGGPGPFDAIGSTIFQAILYLIVGYIVFRLVNAHRLQRAELAEANLQLAYHATTLHQLTLSHERNRLARDLHDTLAHSLSAVAVQLEAVRSLWDEDPGEARSALERSLAATRHGLQETRRAIHDLRASPLEDLGLGLALRHLAQTVTSRAGIMLDLDVPEELSGLSAPIEQGVYRIADEALANVERHAGAGWVRVALQKADGCLALIVEDDGAGFDPTATSPKGHFGLKGMYERASLIGGRLAMDSQPGKGTRIRLHVPI